MLSSHPHIRSVPHDISGCTPPHSFKLAAFIGYSIGLQALRVFVACHERSSTVPRPTSLMVMATWLVIHACIDLRDKLRCFTTHSPRQHLDFEPCKARVLARWTTVDHTIHRSLRHFLFAPANHSNHCPTTGDSISVELQARLNRPNSTQLLDSQGDWLSIRTNHWRLLASIGLLSAPLSKHCGVGSIMAL